MTQLAAEREMAMQNLDRESALVRRLRLAIEELPAAWREVLVLREFEQMSYAELSAVTGTPIGTVMSRLSRARERLRETMCREEA